MEDTRFIKSIRLRNLLSFGPESEEIELRPLNVLIGPNGSGKSNFIDAISILQAAPRDISTPFRLGGGFRNWLWKGDDKTESLEITLSVSLNNTVPAGLPITHRIKLSVGILSLRKRLLEILIQQTMMISIISWRKNRNFSKLKLGRKA